AAGWRSAGGEPGAGDGLRRSWEAPGRHEAGAGREGGRHDRAAAHRLAMQPFAMAEARLDRMAEGMAEVEDGAQPAFALVLADDGGLDLARALDRVRQRGLVARHQRTNVLFDPVEEGRVGDRPILDHL